MKHILFIATAFPESDRDFKGIFIKDYLLSIRKEFDCSIYVFRIWSARKGFHIEITPHYTIYRFSMFSHDVGKIIKCLSYPIFLTLAYYYHKKVNKPDILHVHGALFLGGILGLVLGKKLGKPVIYTEHMGRFEQFYRNWYISATARWILLKFDRITCVSSFTRLKIAAIGLPEKDVTIINNPVDTGLFAIDNRIIEKNNIAFVGRLDENKGIIRCLVAFKNLIDKYNNIRFLIIGDGNQRELIEEMMSYDNELKDHVELMGLVDKKNIAQILSSCRFLVAPSIVESFGISVAEAMACGLPVIVGRNNGTSDFVDEEVGRLIDPANVSELTDTMEWLILNWHRFDPLKIRSRIVDNFCFEVTGKKLSALYQSLY